MNEVWNGIITLGVAIIGIAFLAVLVSKQADTANVLSAAGSAFSGALKAAEGPLSGGTGSTIAWV
jgi:hypothetical protein